MNETNNTTVTEIELSSFVSALSEQIHSASKAEYPTCELNWGRVTLAPLTSATKFAKIIRTREMDGAVQNDGVYCFIELATGNIFKAAGYKAPAKHSRGNIRVGTAANWFNNALTRYGAAYLR